MARLEGTANRTTIEFRAAWDIAATKARFRLVEKLLRWCRSRDPDVSLKAIESVSEMLVRYLRQELTSSVMARLGMFLAAPALRRFKQVIDYAEYGGFPLLGLQSGVIIGHGRSSPRAIRNAIRVCGDYVSHRVSDRIREVLHEDAPVIAPVA